MHILNGVYYVFRRNSYSLRNSVISLLIHVARLACERLANESKKKSEGSGAGIEVFSSSLSPLFLFVPSVTHSHSQSLSNSKISHASCALGKQATTSLAKAHINLRNDVKLNLTQGLPLFELDGTCR